MIELKKIYAKDYKIIPNINVDMTQKIKHMIELNGRDTHFIFEKGVYNFSSDYATQADYYLSNTDVENPRKFSIFIKNMQNIIIDGSGSQFIYAGQTAPFGVDASSDITIKNVDIDWEIPLSAEGYVIKSSKDFVDMKIDKEQFPHYVRDSTLIFKGENWEVDNKVSNQFCEFDATTTKFAYRTGDKFSSNKSEDMGDYIRFYGQFDPIPKVGNFGVLRHSKRLNPAMFFNKTLNINIQNVTVHNSGGLGILCQFCDTINVKNVNFRPNREKGRRVLCGHDDGIHLSNNKGEITVEQCSFYGLMDDPINVHGTSLRVEQIINNNTIKGIFIHPQAVGFDSWADEFNEVSFINRENMSSYGVCLVDKFELISPTEFVINFKQNIPEQLKLGDALENLTNSPSLTCKNNYFGSCRARGVLVSTPKKVVIENNVFDSAGAGILIAGDANCWYESGACADVTIKNNHFNECVTSMYQFCEGIISICPEVPNPQIDKPFHRNIKIIGNTFMAFDYSVLYALSVKGLQFKNNKIIRSHMYTPYATRKHMINLDYCANVEIENNILINDVLGKDIHMNGNSIDISNDGNLQIF